MNFSQCGTHCMSLLMETARRSKPLRSEDLYRDDSIGVHAPEHKEDGR